MIGGDDALTIVLKADDGNFMDVSRRAAQAIEQIGTSAGTMTRQLAQSREGVKLSRQETLALNYTLSDVAASLASGASPFTIMMQQGGQLKDAFGGIGNMFRGLASLVTPITVGITTLVGTLGGAAYAFAQGRKEISEFEKSLILTGNASGMTAGRLAEMAQRVSDASRQTIGESRAIVRELAANGQVSGRVIESTARAVAQLADITGQDAKKIADDFAGMTTGVAKWAAEHNKAWNFITVEQFKYIQRLEEQGKAEQAAVFVNEQLMRHLSSQAKQLGTIERALDGAAKMWSSFWDAALNIGRPATPEDQIADARKQLAFLEEQLARNLKSGRGEGVIKGLGSLNDGLRQQIANWQGTVAGLVRGLHEQEAAVRARSEAATKNRVGIGAAMSEKKKDKPFMGVPDEDLAAEQRFRTEAADIERFMSGAVQSSDERMLRAAEQRRDTEARARQQKLDQAASFAQQLVDGAATADAGLIRQAEARGRALLAIERAQLTSRLTQLGLEGEQRKLMEDEIDRFMVAREAQLTEELKPEWQRRLEAWADTTEMMRTAHADLMLGIVEQGEQAFTTWLKTGKLSARNLVDYIGDQFAKLAYQRYIAGPLASAANAGLSWLFGSGAGGAGADSGASGPGIRFPTTIGGGTATGSNLIERDMLTILHKGEAVIPKAYNPAAGGAAAGPAGVVLNVTYNVPAGQSPAAYAAALDQHTQRIKAEVAADMMRPGRLLQIAAVSAQ